MTIHPNIATELCVGYDLKKLKNCKWEDQFPFSHVKLSVQWLYGNLVHLTCCTLELAGVHRLDVTLIILSFSLIADVFYHQEGRSGGDKEVFVLHSGLTGHRTYCQELVMNVCFCYAHWVLQSFHWTSSAVLPDIWL